jgi:predicted AAA+ superfamily ATPase
MFYATSNRRHLMPRDMIENERSTAIHASEAVEEKVSLSDRFGLWLGFHNCDQDTFFAMVESYAAQPSSSARRPTSGRSPGARDRAVSPGNSYKTWPAASASR